MSKTFSICPGTLSDSKGAYGTTCIRRVFDGHKVSPVLPWKSFGDNLIFGDNRERFSISGKQEKVSLKLQRNWLTLSGKGQHGEYILKTISPNVLNGDQLPANEHLTMQLAQQVFGIPTAENALVFFRDEQPALLVKRFDLKKGGGKYVQEDFASIAQRSPDTHGPDYKLLGSYEEMAEIIRKHVSAYPVALERFFSQVVFNYLFSNGNAHFKNFSLIESPLGDYLLSPAYDLVCTKLHGGDAEMALKDGLFVEGFEPDLFNQNGVYRYEDFKAFGRRIGIPERRVVKLLNGLLSNSQRVEAMVKRSFLSEEMKSLYLSMYCKKLDMMQLHF